MTITLPLQRQEKAKILALARAKGVSPKVLVRTALEKPLRTLPGRWISQLLVPPSSQ